MLEFRKLIGFAAAFAFVLMAVAVGTAEGGAFAGDSLKVDTKVDSPAVNDGEMTLVSAKAGDTIKLELYLAAGAGKEVQQFSLTFDSLTVGGAKVPFHNGDNALDANDSVTLVGMSSDVLPLSSLGGLTEGGLNGLNFDPIAGLVNGTVPASGHLATVTMTTNIDLPDGSILGLQATTTTIGDATGASDAPDVSMAQVTFATPAGPSIAADKGVTQAVVVPFLGTESDTVTVTASNVADTLAINWSVTKAGTDVTITVLDASGMMMSDMMFPTAAGDKTIMLYATGKGASATATIYAVAGTDTTNTIVVQFSRENPVELASFAGELVEDGVMLAWTTASQTNNAGWRMLRSVDGENYEVVSGLLPGAGTTDALLNYSFVDKELPASEVVFYVLEQIDLDGAIHRSNEIEVILGARTLPLPTEFAVNAYPNPFNPSTTISYDLPEAQMVSIVIYDALGQEVRRLVNGQTAAGRYQEQWDAKDNHGRSVGSGVYIAKVEAGSFSTSQKMLLLK